MSPVTRNPDGISQPQSPPIPEGEAPDLRTVTVVGFDAPVDPGTKLVEEVTLKIVDNLQTPGMKRKIATLNRGVGGFAEVIFDDMVAALHDAFDGIPKNRVTAGVMPARGNMPLVVKGIEITNWSPTHSSIQPSTSSTFVALHLWTRYFIEPIGAVQYEVWLDTCSERVKGWEKGGGWLQFAYGDGNPVRTPLSVVSSDLPSIPLCILALLRRSFRRENPVRVEADRRGKYVKSLDFCIHLP